MKRDGFTALPAKNKKKLSAFYYLVEELEKGRIYSEPELNDLLDEWSLFHDPATLRRELFNKQFLDRTQDCRSYWRETEIPPYAEFMAKYL